MRMRVSRLFFRVFVLTIVCCSASCSKDAAERDEEPTYSDHPLSYWVFVERRPYNPLSSHMEWDLDAPGKAAVRRAGRNAIPFLLKWISLDNGYRAAWAFGALGPVAEPAIPELARMATNSDYAIEALGRIGPPAIPALSTLATNRTVRRAPAFHTYTFRGNSWSEPAVHSRTAFPAVMALASMGTNAMAALPALIECLRDEDSNVVSSALSALRGLKACDQTVLVAERGVLNSTNAELRRCALYALAEFGPKALPDIVTTFRDPNADVMSAALGIVSEVAPQVLTNATVVAGAAEGLSSPNRNRRCVSAQVLRAAGQWARGRKVDLSYPVPGGWDAVFQEATNALRRLAPELLDSSPQ